MDLTEKMEQVHKYGPSGSPEYTISEVTTTLLAFYSFFLASTRYFKSYDKIH